MSLTFGIAPFAQPPGGALNLDLAAAAGGPVLYLHPVFKRIRGVLAGETIVDTRRGQMLHETGQFPQWYVPLDEIDPSTLEAQDGRETDPVKGETTRYTVRAGNREVRDAAWSHEPGTLPQLAGLVAFAFDRLDAWFEEDDQIEQHPRDPYHRFDCRRTSEHVQVKVGGQLVAETRRAVKLFETSIPPRYYIPFDDVTPECLVPSATRGYCPYKGRQSYYSVRGGGITIEDGAWTIYEPYGEALAVVGCLSFWQEGTEVLADGQPTPI